VDRRALGHNHCHAVKIFLNLVAIVILGLGWAHFVKARSTASDLLESADKAAEVADFETADRNRKQARHLDGQATFTGILLAFLSTGYVGILVVTYVLPVLANKLTHAVYDSGELLATDPMREAHALLAQGEYAAAVEAFRAAAASDAGNRLPWIEMAKIQREHLKDSREAIATLREALENHEWAENDAGFMLFRLAELYLEDLGDEDAAVAMMHQVIEQFPETRHSANARHRLHEWGRDVA
jgi:tetratricopeptide (TPR) repeat protein